MIAIYEVGQSFFRGWGVEKDKKMGVVSGSLFSIPRLFLIFNFQSYFRAAAGMGDPDAQQSLAFALEHGKGCKKDRKEAALWYRAAVCIQILSALFVSSLQNIGQTRGE